MYDENQHIELFQGPGAYLFRGCLPSTAFEAEYRGPGVTPTSVDPIVATLFACRYRMGGPAAVFLARKSDFADLLDGPNLTTFAYELAVNIDLTPTDFERRCLVSIPVDESIVLLRNLGYNLPSRLPDLGALTQALTQSPRMPGVDIERYVQGCLGLRKEG